jgi:hypothetical protein
MALPKHHYIPVFYLKQWAGPDGRLVEFSRPHGSIVKPRRTHPDGTGFVRGLYRLPGVPDDVAETIEQKFFKELDDYASYAHKRILRRYMIDWSPRMRTAWSQFILGILLRSPKTVSDTKLMVGDGIPEIWEEARSKHASENPNSPAMRDYDAGLIDRTSLIALQRFISNEKMVRFVNGMIWSACDVAPTRYRFLTSDRPIVITDGLGYPESHIAVPVSPTMLFLATNTEQTAKEIQAMHVKDLVFNANKQVVRHAVQYVWAHDESQTALIKSQMSSEAHNNPNFFKDRTGPQRPLIPAARDVV